MKNPHAHYKNFLRTQGFNNPGLLKERHPKIKAVKRKSIR